MKNKKRTNPRERIRVLQEQIRKTLDTYDRERLEQELFHWQQVVNRKPQSDS